MNNIVELNQKEIGVVCGGVVTEIIVVLGGIIMVVVVYYTRRITRGTSLTGLPNPLGPPSQIL